MSRDLKNLATSIPSSANLQRVLFKFATILTMIEAVIFDFGRTLYNPETSRLFPQTEEVLAELNSRKLKLALVSIADRTKTERLDDLVKLKIRDYFRAIHIFGRREEKDFTAILDQLEVASTNTMIIGDNLKREITLGNTIGAYTVWTKQNLSGPYIPKNELQTPNATIEQITELIPIIADLNNR